MASLVQFIDGLPFKPGYKRFKIRGVAGVDDFASIHEVVARRFQRLDDEAEMFPDILLIDGGKGQLNAALAAFAASWASTPPTVISLAKREEEIYVAGRGRAAAAEPPCLCPAAAAIRPATVSRTASRRDTTTIRLRNKSQMGGSERGSCEAGA